MAIALDAGADDLKRSGDHFEITCDPTAFNQVKTALEQQHVTLDNAEITQLAKVSVEKDLETSRKVLRLMEALDDHDDAQNVYSNLHLTDEILAAAGEE